MNMDNFTRYENGGRAKLQKIFDSSVKISQYHFTTDKYNPVDCYVTASTDQTYSYEIKDRRINFDEYKEDGFVLELHKYNDLMQVYENSGYTPIYINFFPDGIGCLWELADIDITPMLEWRDMSKTTAENYNKGEMHKEVIMLSPTIGKLFRYE